MSGPAAGSTDVAPGAGTIRATQFTAWRSLPALAVGTALTGLGQVVAVLLAPALGWLSVPALLVLVGPPAGLLVAAAVRTIAGVETGMVELFRGGLATVVRSVALLIPPVGCGWLLVAAGEVWRQTGQALLIVPYGLSAAATVITVLAAVTAWPLGLGQPRRPWRRVWFTALVTTARRPVPALAVVAVVIIGHWAASTLYLPLWWLVPLPAALLAARTRRDVT